MRKEKSSRRYFRRFLRRSKISLLLEFRVFLDIFKIFAEDCFSDRGTHASTPTQSTINIASAKLGVVRILPFSLVPAIRTPQISPDEEGLLWGWYVVGGPLCFLLRSFRKFLPFAFLRLSCFQNLCLATIFGPWQSSVPSSSISATQQICDISPSVLMFLGSRATHGLRRIRPDHVIECSKPSLKFVKAFLRSSLSRPGHWEDNNTKNHEEWPKKSPMATNRRLISD